jgi:hypothetical protein
MGVLSFGHTTYPSIHMGCGLYRARRGLQNEVLKSPFGAKLIKLLQFEMRVLYYKMNSVMEAHRRLCS